MSRNYKILSNLQYIPADAKIATDEPESEVAWPRLPIEGETYIAQDDDGNIYVQFGNGGWYRAIPLQSLANGDNKIALVKWDSGYDLHPRSGWIGRILDKFFPRYIHRRDAKYIATTESGDSILSSDGMTWGRRI